MGVVEFSIIVVSLFVISGGLFFYIKQFIFIIPAGIITMTLISSVWWNNEVELGEYSIHHLISVDGHQPEGTPFMIDTVQDNSRYISKFITLELHDDQTTTLKYIDVETPRIFYKDLPYNKAELHLAICRTEFILKDIFTYPKTKTRKRNCVGNYQNDILYVPINTHFN